MNIKIRLFIVSALVLAVIGLARNQTVWAVESFDLRGPLMIDSTISLQNSEKFGPEPTELTITESGIYTIGGLCTLEVMYKQESGLQVIVDVNVPTDFSTDIPFGYEGDLYLPGCHVVHYKNNEIKRVADPEDGTWKICFAERPNVELTIYYYHDDPFTDFQIWIEQETTHADGFACVSALFTGEYAPGNKRNNILSLAGGLPLNPPPPLNVGSVVPPPPSSVITKSGSYSIGGICNLNVLYHEPEQSNVIHVADALRHDEDPVDDYNNIDFNTFPEGEGLLNLPGCHVVHYKQNEITHWEKGVDQGDWEICFAAPPEKLVTIYYYLGDLTNQESEWSPLETTVEFGIACAPAFFTGVYVPTSQSF